MVQTGSETGCETETGTDCVEQIHKMGAKDVTSRVESSFKSSYHLYIQ